MQAGEMRNSQINSVQKPERKKPRNIVGGRITLKLILNKQGVNNKYMRVRWAGHVGERDEKFLDNFSTET